MNASVHDFPAHINPTVTRLGDALYAFIEPKLRHALSEDVMATEATAFQEGWRMIQGSDSIDTIRTAFTTTPPDWVLLHKHGFDVSHLSTQELKTLWPDVYARASQRWEFVLQQLERGLLSEEQFMRCGTLSRALTVRPACEVIALEPPIARNAQKTIKEIEVLATEVPFSEMARNHWGKLAFAAVACVAVGAWLFGQKKEQEHSKA